MARPLLIRVVLALAVIGALLVARMLVTREPEQARARPAYPLKVSANGRHLVRPDGTPFLINADTAWFVFDKLSVEEYDVYLDKRVAIGFNTVQVMAPWHYNRPNFYGEDPFATQGDVSSPNEAWWARVDTFVAKAAARSVVVNIVPLWLGYTNEEWGAVLEDNSLAACYAFGEFLGERFKNSPNVMWTIGGDHDPTGGIYEREDQIGRGIRSRSPDALMSAHAGENQSSVDQYGAASWLTLNATYTYFPEWYDKGSLPVYVLSEKDYNRDPVRPFFLIESGYEDTVHTGPGTVVRPDMVRRQAYWSALSGSTGFAYGNVDVWPFNGGTPPAWLEALDDPGAAHVGHAHRMLTARAWHELVPDFDHTVVTAGYGTYWNPGIDTGNDYVTAARSGDGSLVVAYLPSTRKAADTENPTEQRTLTVDMTKLAGTATASWFNPVDATYQAIGSYPNTAPQTFTTPGGNGDGNDWVLLIETKPAAQTPS